MIKNIPRKYKAFCYYFYIYSTVEYRTLILVVSLYSKYLFWMIICNEKCKQTEIIFVSI